MELNYDSRQFILIKNKLKLKAFMRGRAEKAMLENGKSGSCALSSYFSVVR